jgi:hypothetical protein
MDYIINKTGIFIDFTVNTPGAFADFIIKLRIFVRLCII